MRIKSSPGADKSHMRHWRQGLPAKFHAEDDELQHNTPQLVVIYSGDETTSTGDNTEKRFRANQATAYKERVAKIFTP